MPETRNVDEAVVAAFGDEWTRFDQTQLSVGELNEIFESYFSIFPWDSLSPNAVGLDFGCGSGRWARLVAPRVGWLHCVDASPSALAVARRVLAGVPNCEFHLATADDIPLPDGSVDFGYSLGVLHHVPDTAGALKRCVSKLRKGAPFLLYLYHRLEKRPVYTVIWWASELLRVVISRLPNSLRYATSQLLAGAVYWPLARLARLLERLGIRIGSIPLHYYRYRSFYVMRTDALDRFGTRLAKRFTKQDITEMMKAAGLRDVVFSDQAPFWCAVGRRRAVDQEVTEATESALAGSSIQRRVYARTLTAGHFASRARAADRSTARLRVIAFCTYPIEGPSTRYRVTQFRQPLAEQGVELVVVPFLRSETFATLYDRGNAIKTTIGVAGGILRRFRDVLNARHFDVAFVQREAMLVGPPIVERALAKLDLPLVLDLDDARYIEPESPVYGRLATLLKWPGKTNTLIDLARVVISGSQSIADTVASRGRAVELLPTIVDVDFFRPSAARPEGTPVVGWIGTHSTFEYLEPLIPVLQRVARQVPFKLLIVGSGRQIVIPEVDVICRDWALQRDLSDFQSLDVGLYPLPDDHWAAAKSGFKAVQYLSVGVPYVASPVGAVSDIAIAGSTHLLAASDAEWEEALLTLLRDRARRLEMGSAGRLYAQQHFSVQRHAVRLAEIFRQVLPSRE